MSKEPKIDADEVALFRRAMSDVKRLKHDTVAHESPRPAPVPKQFLADEARVPRDSLSDQFDPAEMETGEELVFVRAGLQKTVLRKLRRGQYSIGDELDLHGHTQEAARAALSRFLHDAVARQLRCVRIIHGKGHRSRQNRPVLKVKVNNWLRQRDEVLAFCSARPVDGGTGALYVLLKRQVL